MIDDFKLIRQSLIEWYPVKLDDNMLLINGGDSAIDELMEDRCHLRVAGDLKAVNNLIDESKTYDLILMYDAYGFCLDNNISISELLSRLLSLKGDNGRLFLALENKLGMKYWAGCQEEQKGGVFVGIEDYSTWEGDIKPLSKKELEEVLSGLENVTYEFYYPYPDYKYPTIIYSDKCLPKEGELFRNMRNVDRERLVIFDERRAFDSVIKAGLFPEFSNSYLISIV